MRELLGVLLVVALVLSFSLVATAPVAAATLEVGNDKPYPTIQAAINDAVNGDTILVYPGTYEENPDMSGKALTITGVPDNGVLPIIKGTLRIANSSGPTTVEYLSFIANFDGHNDPWDSSHNNSMFIRSAHDITVSHCTFDGSGRFMDTPYSRSAINVLLSSDITIDSCVIENGYYMAIYALAGSPGVNNLTVRDSVFRNNKSGINLNEGDNLVVENTDIGVVAQAADSDSYGVRIATDSVGFHYVVGGENMTITGGTFTVDPNGYDAEEGTYHAAIVIRSQADGELIVRGATILGDVVYSNRVRYSGAFGPGDEVDPPGLDARFNWWGDASGPYNPLDNPDGKGAEVVHGVGDVLFEPWYFLDEPDIPITSYDEVVTETGTGTAKFGASDGDIEGLQAVPAVSPAPRGVSFPHGMFEFRIENVTPAGATVTLAIELPQPVPVGTVWWKHEGTGWYSLPNLRDNGDNIMVIELTDGGLGDGDGEADGTITDPGGPGNPVPPLAVGWEGSSVHKAAVGAPWIALFAAIIAGATLLMVRRRRAQTW